MTWRRYLLAAWLLVVACGIAPVSATSVNLSEFSITPAATTLEAGEIELTAHNSGEFSHTLVISRADGTVVAGTELIGPGETATMAVTLAEGTYMFTCRIVGQTDTGELVDHYERGMVARMRVTAPEA